MNYWPVPLGTGRVMFLWTVWRSDLNKGIEIRDRFLHIYNIHVYKEFRLYCYRITGIRQAGNQVGYPANEAGYPAGRIFGTTLKYL